MTILFSAEKNASNCISCSTSPARFTESISDSDEETEGGNDRVTVGGHEFAVNKPSRRSTISVLDAAAAEEGESDASVRVPAGGPRALARKRSSMSAVPL